MRALKILITDNDRDFAKKNEQEYLVGRCPGPNAQPERRILVVDDDRDFADSLKDILDAYGYHVEAVYDRHSAEEFGKRFRPQVALVDIRLGATSGIDLLRRLNSQHIGVLCVLMTAFAAAETAVQALRNGAYDYLCKPFQAEELLATLERAFEKLHLEETRRRAEEALFREKERAQVTLHCIGDAVITTDEAGLVEYMNPVAETLTGWTLDEVRGRSMETVVHVVHEQSRERIRDLASKTQSADEGGRLADQCVLVGRGGQEYAIHVSVAPIRNREGKVFGVVVTFKDMTVTRRLAQEMAYQATHDALTGLVNRREFEHRLQRVLTTARVEKTEHALCYLDLDQFKVINDTCGHAAGDELLRQLGTLLQVQARKRDTLARIGGDEFGIVLERCSITQAARVAEAMRAAIQDFQFLWENRSFSIGVSIGLVPVTEASASVDSVLRAADSACYTAKEEGRNRIHVYRQDDVKLARRHGEMQWVVRLPQALAENRFHLNFQPIAPISRVECAGAHYELLLRMEDESGHMVAPGAFLPAAERYNMAVKIDTWVVGTALQWLKHHPKHVAGLRLCAINLSGLSLGNEEFLDFVQYQLKETAIDPRQICFEVTETAVITNLAAAKQFISVMGRKGCQFALDDFGSGLCSFAYLKNLPVQFLKIDGSFVKDVLNDPFDVAMVRSIHAIGQVMGKQTIAEFVENEAILEIVQTMGIDYAQGYRIGRPRPIEEME